ncbi:MULTISPECIES: MobV family relaxase [unclassified Halomonas]|uniref:MobV family relaxase n=1 Tax=unclassified Halomonas TaxID=2609666 RepID=UPI001C97E02C|nr:MULTISPECIES: MobV family relaxase [unclassified Halomonas]MBY5927471.1 plasmid recombination protein [Halomonas sp. DP4Y7-2]MBY6234512.1 plasmid recombination protein [Halomonas sp. DP4Y7-1]
MYAFVRTQKLKTRKKIDNAHAHNARTYTPPNANPLESNTLLYGSRESYWKAIQERLEETGIKPRKDAVLAQELVLGASPEHFRPGYHRDDPNGFGRYDEATTKKFAEDSLKWLKKKYGRGLVSVELHTDERTPHIHAVVMPIVSKTMKRRRTKQQIKNKEKPKTYTALRLDADSLFGKKAHQTLQKEFADAVCLSPGVRNAKVYHTDQHDFYKSIERAKKAKTPVFQYTETKVREKKLLESSVKYAQYVSNTIKKNKQEDKRENTEKAKQSHKDATALAEQNRRLQYENDQHRKRLKALGDIEPDKLAQFVEKYKKHEEQQKLERQKNHSTPSPSPHP